jgi:hypothetical protein
MASRFFIEADIGAKVFHLSPYDVYRLEPISY